MTPPDEDWVYVIWAYGLPEPTVKIGHTTDIFRRLGELQTGSPVQLEVFAAWLGTEEDETQLHEQFSAHRLRGEWFRGVPEILDLARYHDQWAGWWDVHSDKVWRDRFDHLLPPRSVPPNGTMPWSVAWDEEMYGAFCVKDTTPEIPEGSILDVLQTASDDGV